MIFGATTIWLLMIWQALPYYLADRSLDAAAIHCESCDQSKAVTSAWH